MRGSNVCVAIADGYCELLLLLLIVVVILICLHIVSTPEHMDTALSHTADSLLDDMAFASMCGGVLQRHNNNTTTNNQLHPMPWGTRTDELSVDTGDVVLPVPALVIESELNVCVVFLLLLLFFMSCCAIDIVVCQR